MYKTYAKRFLICILGLAFFAFGNLLGVKAGSAGTNAWNTLALGCGPRDTLMVIIGKKFQFACKVMRYEPQNVEHENLIDTWKKGAVGKY